MVQVEECKHDFRSIVVGVERCRKCRAYADDLKAALLVVPEPEKKRKQLSK